MFLFAVSKIVLLIRPKSFFAGPESRFVTFITLKDHKENFNNNPTISYMNPAKNELGRISKAI